MRGFHFLSNTAEMRKSPVKTTLQGFSSTELSTETVDRTADRGWTATAALTEPLCGSRYTDRLRALFDPLVLVGRP